MAVLSPPRVLGATGQQLSAKLLRLTDAAKWRPSGAALGTLSGVVAGPAGGMGELTLVNPTTLNVNPFVAVVQGSLSADQGAYEVPNDALVALAITGQHASQYRRALVMVSVDDSQASGVASSATTDRARLLITDGALSAVSPGALPAVPANTLLLGEIGIPPVGQTVTLTPYNPRTTTRGGILPVINDASILPGHAGALPVFDGQYRHHPVNGLEVAEGGVWVSAASRTAPLFRARRQALMYFSQNTFTTIGWDTEDLDTHNGFVVGSDGGYACQRAGWYLCRAFVTLGAAPPGRTIVRFTKNGAGAYIGASRPNASNGNPGAACEGFMNMIVGDKAFVQVYSDAGPTWNTDSPDFAPTLFEMQWLRPL